VPVRAGLRLCQLLRPALGLRPWFAFERRALARRLLVRLDMAPNTTGLNATRIDAGARTRRARRQEHLAGLDQLGPACAAHPVGERHTGPHGAPGGGACPDRCARSRVARGSLPLWLASLTDRPGRGLAPCVPRCPACPFGL